MSRIIAILPLVLAAVAAGQSTPATMPAPIPPQAEQARARELVQTLFKNDLAKTAPADRRALAKTLLVQASATHDDPAARYVLLAMADDLASTAGDAATAAAAIEQLAQSYAAIDALDLQRQAFSKADLAPLSQADAELLANLSIQAADAAAALDRFDAATQLAGIAESAAAKSRQVAFAGSMQPRLNTLRELAAEYQQVQKAIAAIAAPATPPASLAEAHLLAGRFYALHKGQWLTGLPHLAQGSDPLLRTLAARELDHPASDVDQLDLADRWWDFAQASTGLAKSHATAHAIDWYKTAERSIQGITLLRIQSRIQGESAKSAAPAAVQHGVDLLALVDPARDAVEGRWSRGGADLAVESASYSTLSLPYAPPEEYDLRVTFTRKEGAGPVAVLLAAQKRAFEFVLDIKGDARFERINNKVAQDNPTVTPVSISNGHRYTLTVQVRKDVVRALLNDKLLCEHKTDLKDLSRYNVWKSRDTGLCALGAHNAAVLFHAVEMVEVTGKGKPAR